MSKIVNVGQRFGRLLIKNKHHERHRGYHVQWVCLCDPEYNGCGKTALVTTGNLNRGTQSCGCLIREAIRKSKVTHGLTKTTEYRIWRGVVQRCHNENHDHYDKYGGRGIVMCDEWRSDFMIFLRDMGPRPSTDHSIDRKDNDKGYSKDNCRWATSEEQMRNRSNNVYYEKDGEKKLLRQWCDELGLNTSTVYDRIRRGWTFEEAIVPKIEK